MNEYARLATAAARGGWHVHQHVINNSAVTDLLNALEPVNRTQRFDSLRWTLGHVYDISPANLARAKALGMTLGVHGAAMQAGARMPLRTIASSGIVFGLGTDAATIVSHYKPFVTLGWAVSGLDAGDNLVLDETLTREEALIAHTRSNAYLFFQEKTLGSLEVGKQADLVVLDRDYMTVPAADMKAHPSDAHHGWRARRLQRLRPGSTIRRDEPDNLRPRPCFGWRRARPASRSRRRLMGNSQRALLLSLATLVLSSDLATAGQSRRRRNGPPPLQPLQRRARAVTSPEDPFLGVWKLSAEKSKDQAGGAPKSFTRTYEDCGGGTIFMTTDVTIPEGSTRAYLVYRRDGQPYPEAALGAQSIRMVTVKAVDSGAHDLYFIVDGKTSERPSTINVFLDGLTMTQVVSGKNSKGQAFTNTVVYDKQP